MGPLARLAFGYKTLETGCWLDIFPVDHCTSEKCCEDIRDTVNSDVVAFRKFYLANEKKLSVEELLQKKKDQFSSIAPGEYNVWFHGPEFKHQHLGVWPDEVIFPLGDIAFESYTFKAPHDIERYIKELPFGKGYMEYPRGGMLHHGDPDGTSVAGRAKKHGTDMQAVIAHLRSVAERL